MYWCPHCEKLMEKRSKILPEGVCSCGHPHLCECQTVESYGKKEYRQISGLLEDNALGMHADESALNLAGILCGKFLLKEGDVEALFGLSGNAPVGEEFHRGTISETLMRLLKNKGILNIDDCLEILTPSKKEPTGMFNRRITITLLYLLMNRGIITEEEFYKALDPVPRAGLDD